MPRCRSAEKKSSRHTSAISRTDYTSRNISAANSTGTNSRLSTRNKSAVCKGNLEPRNNSKVYGLDRSLSRNNSAVRDLDSTNSTDNSERKNTFQNNSAESVQSRNNSSKLRTGYVSRNNSAISRQRNSSAIFRTEESRENVTSASQHKMEEEIVKGNRISIPTVDTSVIDEALSSRTKILEHPKHATGNEGYDVLRDSPRTVDRTELLSRGSSLMLGSGRVRKSNDKETLELHFDNADYSNLLDHETSHVLGVTIGMKTITVKTITGNENKLSLRPVEVQLPKTYITKTGSLFLYSDSKVIKDKRSETLRSSQSDNKNIEVTGQKMSPRTLVPQAYPYWRKLLNRRKPPLNTDRTKTGCLKRDQLEYINSHSCNNNPYSWDFTVLPEKVINKEDEEVIKTVNSLSEAVLAYRSTSPSSRDKYMAMMKQTRDGKTKGERMNEIQTRQPQSISTWTQEWTGRQGIKDNETDTMLIARLRNSLKRSVHTPVNTPLVGTKR